VSLNVCSIHVLTRLQVPIYIMRGAASLWHQMSRSSGQHATSSSGSLAFKSRAKDRLSGLSFFPGFPQSLRENYGLLEHVKFLSQPLPSTYFLIHCSLIILLFVSIYSTNKYIHLLGVVYIQMWTEFDVCCVLGRLIVMQLIWLWCRVGLTIGNRRKAKTDGCLQMSVVCSVGFLLWFGLFKYTASTAKLHTAAVGHPRSVNCPRF
jgi:hypothetical protein